MEHPIEAIICKVVLLACIVALHTRDGFAGDASVSRSNVKCQSVNAKANGFSFPRLCGSQTRAPFSN
jgi:hypothetical protein